MGADGIEMEALEIAGFGREPFKAPEVEIPPMKSFDWNDLKVPFPKIYIY